MPSSRGSSQPRDRTQVSHTAGGFFTDSHQGSPRILEWGSPSLLQGYFQSQESDQVLLYCRLILYKLSSQGSPNISFMKVKLLSRVQLFVTPWKVTYQVPWSVEFSRQEYWSGLPFPSPRDHSDPGIKPVPLACLAMAGRFFNSVSPGKPTYLHLRIYCSLHEGLIV